ncbi:MAG: ATP-dependent zinc metalloprotease FtsH [Planctomycetota bacterium]
MTDSSQQDPKDPRRDEGSGGEDRPRKGRSYTGYILVALILIITYLVIQNSIGKPKTITLPNFFNLLLRGRVEGVTIEKNTLAVKLTESDAKSGKAARVNVPESFISQHALDLEEMAEMGREAAGRDEKGVDELYILFGRALAKGSEPNFLVYKRYVLSIGGKNSLLVKMSRPPLNDLTDSTAGGIDDVEHTGLTDSFLLEPKSVVGNGESYNLTFNDLLKVTNTSAFNLAHGLPSPTEVTVPVVVGKKGTFSWAEGDELWQKLLVSLIPWVLIIAFLWFFVFRQMRGGGVGGNVLSFGKSRAKIANRETSKVTFADVAGIDEAKAEVEEIVEFLKNPQRFARLGGRTPRGVLLAGSPGTGKTLLAKAIAGEAEVPFYSISGSDFVEMFVGVGASRVRDLFKQARENSPCIVFLDEIDAVGRRRGAGLGGGHDEREQTLNAILVEMDGFDTDTGIIVVAATNRVDVLDPALLRPGRFDRQINVSLPDVRGREAILGVHVKGVKMHPSVNLEKIARGTPGFSGAELEALVNESAILATMAKKDYVYEEDLEEARDRIRWGRAKRSRIMDEADQKITAYHEAGHTIASWLLPDADPLHKVTIIPRGPSLGATMYLPDKDRYSMTKGQMETFLKICFGGRLAEELFCGDITSGAANDIKQATDLARRMVQEWGMTDSVGLISYEVGEENPFLGRDIGRQHRISDATAERIEIEVRRIISEAYEACRELLVNNSDKLELLAEALLEYETLDKEEIDGLLNGESIEAVRERAREAQANLERERKEATRPQVTPRPQPDPDPNPDFPSGLAGEGAG